MGVDFFEPTIWKFIALGLLILTPLQNAVGRKWVLATLNVMVVCRLLDYSKQQIILFVVGLVCLYAMLQLLQKGLKRTLVAGIAGSILFCLWLLYKLPALSHKIASGRLAPVLVAVGFSYVVLRIIDVMRAVMEEGKPAPDFAQTINYLIPFNMLAAGPIQAYDEFVAQPSVPDALTFKQALEGAERIVQGLFKKYVLAISIDRLFLTGFRSHGGYLFLEVQLYYLWLYLDFSAYSDIAIGIGALLGIATPENFNRPFLARNVIDFWQRWHISLSLFIRRNVFLPLQLAFVRRTGGKHQLAVASLAFLISFTLCGLWHNISMPFLWWGLLQAVGLIVCNAYRTTILKRKGRKWLNQQLANPWLTALSVVSTYEFVAFSLYVEFHHYK
jgi:D-alanyl-lipoteichoic acid acyltransferase DltB (MBOAT superfamily)